MGSIVFSMARDNISGNQRSIGFKSHFVPIFQLQSLAKVTPPLHFGFLSLQVETVISISTGLV